MKGFLFALALLTSMSLAYGQDIDFKGVRFGASMQEFKRVHPRAECSPRKGREYFEYFDQTCAMLNSRHGATFASEEADITARFFNNRLGRVLIGNIYSSRMSVVVNALTQRFGQAHGTNTYEYTDSGRTTEFVWKRGGVTLTATKRGEKFSQVEYETDWFRIEHQRRTNRKGAGDV